MTKELEEPTAQLAGALPFWETTLSRTLTGLAHEMNGPLSVLSGLIQLAQLDQQLDDELGVSLETELDRLETMIRLLGPLSTDDDEPEPVRLSDPLTAALTLLRCQKGMEELVLDRSDEPATPPILAAPASLTRALLALLTAASDAGPGEASEPDSTLNGTDSAAVGESPRSLRTRLWSDGDEVILRIERGAGEAVGDQNISGLAASEPNPASLTVEQLKESGALQTLSALVQSAGGAFRTTGGATLGFEVRFPVLEGAVRDSVGL